MEHGSIRKTPTAPGMRNRVRTAGALGLAVAACMLGGGAVAAESGSAAAVNNPEGYVQNRADEFVRNSAGECWHTRAWSPEDRILPCNPELAQKEEPAPPPVVAKVEPPQPMPKKISLSSDAYFGFDKATLRPDAEDKLNQIVQMIQGTKNTRIQITGYTDPIGSDRYNQTLSQRRAQAVRDYLVNHGIEPSVIAADGRGEQDLVATCPGKTGQALIQCYQPNRRTEIEFSALEASPGQQQQPQ